MGVQPRTKSKKIAFCQMIAPRWAENAGEIGVAPQQAVELEAKAAEASARMLEFRQAQQAAMAARMAMDHAIEAMSQDASALIKQIRAFADVNGEEVYVKASISAPARPTRQGQPGKPERLQLTLTGNGALLLKWDCDNPRNSRGTMYLLSRRVGDGGFEPLAKVGKRQYLDVSIPTGATVLCYQIQAIRSTCVGDATLFPVGFGSNGVNRLSWQTRSNHAIVAA